jgi:RNA polymerase sigma factor (sigma-70 family)
MNDNEFKKYYEEEFAKYKIRIIFYFRKWGFSDSSEDMTQEVSLRAYEALKKTSKIIPTNKFISYLFDTCKSVRVDEWRKKSRQIKTLSTDYSENDVPNLDVPTEDAIYLNEQRTLLYSEIMRLNQIQRTILILRIYAEFSNAEIANRLGIPSNRVRQSFLYATRKIRKNLERKGKSL